MVDLRQNSPAYAASQVALSGFRQGTPLHFQALRQLGGSKCRPI